MSYSERFGKIMQDQSSFSINRSQHLESAIPLSKIAALSSGEFVSMVADDPDQKIELTAFRAEILNDHTVMKKEQDNFQPIPLNRGGWMIVLSSRIIYKSSKM
jgi:hypothetical protein